jgi:hypothetical protein
MSERMVTKSNNVDNQFVGLSTLLSAKRLLSGHVLASKLEVVKLIFCNSDPMSLRS